MQAALNNYKIIKIDSLLTKLWNFENFLMHLSGSKHISIVFSHNIDGQLCVKPILYHIHMQLTHTLKQQQLAAAAVAAAFITSR